jgi:hypothetical protein
LAGKTKEEAKGKKATYVTLYSQKVAPTTLTRYTKAVAFFAYFQLNVMGFCATELGAIDKQLASYVEWLWQEGESKTFGTDAIAGSQYFMKVKRCFTSSWDLVKIWGRIEMPARAPPMQLLIVWAFAAFAHNSGRGDLGTVLLLGYHCLLRSAEMGSICLGDITFNANFCGVLALPWTKGGCRKGAREMVTIDDPIIGRLVSLLLQGRPAADPLCRGGAVALRSSVVRASIFFGITHLDLSLYSVRRGGSTHDYTFHRSMERTVFRGRWEHAKTAKIYIAEGLSLLSTLSLTENRTKQIEAYVAAWMNKIG